MSVQIGSLLPYTHLILCIVLDQAEGSLTVQSIIDTRDYLATIDYLPKSISYQFSMHRLNVDYIINVPIISGTNHGQIYLPLCWFWSY